MTWKAPQNAALILVDLQKDFCPGGALAVTDGDVTIPFANELKTLFNVVVVTQDFHRQGHKSFASNHASKNPFETIQMPYGTQVLWPDHCVQGTSGVQFHGGLNLDGSELLLQKGTNIDVDSYSGFYENDMVSKPLFRDGRTLTETLKARGHYTCCHLRPCL